MAKNEDTRDASLRVSKKMRDSSRPPRRTPAVRFVT